MPDKTLIVIWAVALVTCATLRPSLAGAQALAVLFVMPHKALQTEAFA